MSSNSFTVTNYIYGIYPGIDYDKTSDNILFQILTKYRKSPWGRQEKSSTYMKM